MILTDDFKYLFDILMKIKSDYYLCWAVHTTICLAVIGWIIAQKTDFTKSTKIFASIGYTFFLALMIYTFNGIYRHWERAIIDIKEISSKVIESLPTKGFIINFLDIDFIEARIITYIICICCYIIVLFIIFLKPFLFKKTK